VAADVPWVFDSDGALFRLAYLFDPLLAVSTSLVEPLPHQITAVYASISASSTLHGSTTCSLGISRSAISPTMPRIWIWSRTCKRAAPYNALATSLQ
jgi:hypothetical protein